MSAKRDYYEVLGVSRSASGAELKRAFRKRTMECHPDRNPGDTAAEEQFKELAEAFKVLSDPQKRQLYDQFGHEGPAHAGFSAAENISDIFSDLFESFGFGGRRPGRARRGADLRVELPLGLGDVFEGGEHDITVPQRDRCEDCGGTGAASGTTPQRCGQCGGTGQVIHRQGFFTLQTTCPACRGEGKLITNPCRGCGGTGVVQRASTFTINVPAGAHDGLGLRVQGRGHPGENGGPPGNLYVIIRVRADPRFVREEDDIHSKVEISMFQAALGCTVKADTLEGPQDLEIEPGTQPGTAIRLRGKGMPVLGGRGRGDHHVHVEVRIPDDLAQDHLVQLREIAEARGESIAEPGRGLFGFRKKRKRG